MSSTPSRPWRLTRRDVDSAKRHLVVPLVAGVLAAVWAVVETAVTQSGPAGLATLSWADLGNTAKIAALAFFVRLGQRWVTDMQAAVAKQQQEQEPGSDGAV